MREFASQRISVLHFVFFFELTRSSRMTISVLNGFLFTSFTSSLSLVAKRTGMDNDSPIESAKQSGKASDLQFQAWKKELQLRAMKVFFASIKTAHM